MLEQCFYAAAGSPNVCRTVALRSAVSLARLEFPNACGITSSCQHMSTYVNLLAKAACLQARKLTLRARPGQGRAIPSSCDNCRMTIWSLPSQFETPVYVNVQSILQLPEDPRMVTTSPRRYFFILLVGILRQEYPNSEAHVQW